MLTSRAMHLLAGSRQAAARCTGRMCLQHNLQRAAGNHGAVRAMATDVATAATPDQASPSGPVYVDFTVYKGKGALTVKPLRPRWTQLDNGGWKRDKEGCFMFEVAASLGERRYDWDRKIAISLSPLELATLMTATDSEHTFYHDTFKGQPGREGTLVKTLKWSVAPDGNVYFVNASMTDKTDGTEKKVSASVSLTAAEVFILRQLVSNSMSAMFGFDLYYNRE